MLKISGTNATVQDLLTMLQDAASMGSLQPGDSVRLSKERSSPTLHRCLRTIIDDSFRHAQVTAGGGAIHFGNFSEWQLVNVVNAVRISAGVPGLGAVIAFHEIWENYASRGDGNKRGPYGPAHVKALAVERDIATELLGEEGGRVAAFELGENAADGYIFDYEQYFVVLATRPKEAWPSGRFDAVIRQRSGAGDFTIGGLPAGQRVGADRLGDVLTALTENPRASAKVTGQRTGAEGPEASGQRATAVRSAIAIALDPERLEYAGQDGSILLARDAASPGTTAGALRVWAGPEQVTDEEPGAVVELEEPAGED
jgi:hypothetical protein